MRGWTRCSPGEVMTIMTRSCPVRALAPISHYAHWCARSSAWPAHRQQQWRVLRQHGGNRYPLAPPPDSVRTSRRQGRPLPSTPALPGRWHGRRASQSVVVVRCACRQYGFDHGVGESVTAALPRRRVARQIGQRPVLQRALADRYRAGVRRAQTARVRSSVLCRRRCGRLRSIIAAAYRQSRLATSWRWPMLRES